MFRGKRLFMGLGGGNQGYSACLASGGQVLVAIEEERLTRRKYGIGANLLVPKCRRYCLETVGASSADIDAIVATDICNRAFLHGVRRDCELVNHHLAHASSSFFASPFSESAIVVADANGSPCDRSGSLAVETLSWFVGQGGSIHRLGTIYGTNPRWQGPSPSIESNDMVLWLEGIDNSIGYLYAKVSSLLGFGFVEGAIAHHTEDGKTMGLSAYGTDRYLTLFEPFLEFEDAGKLRIRSDDTDALSALVKDMLSEEAEDPHNARADIAAAIQHVTEQVILHVASHVKRTTGLENLCLAGGLALNSVANGRLATSGLFKNVFVPPAPDDAGTAIGCAFLAEQRLDSSQLSPSRRTKTHCANLGRPYTNAAVRTAIEETPGITARLSSDICADVAQLLAAGLTIGWFQDRAEFGPRALGFRSILTLPRPKDRKDLLNNAVKFRESFRPFAAVVISEEASKYFRKAGESPYMSFVFPVEDGKRDLIPATVHVDGSSRIQTVTRQSNSLLYELLLSIGKLTGVPILLNTSFNAKDEPIVETPQDAISCFLRTGIDVLVCDKYILRKKAFSRID